MAAALALCALPAVAQVPATQIAGNPVTPRTWPSAPCGGAVVGGFFFSAGCADGIEGWRNYTTDTGNVDTAIQLFYNSSQDNSIGGNAPCVPFCRMGKVFYDGATSVFATSDDNKAGGGQPGSITFAGVWRFDLVVFQGQPFWQTQLLAPNAGLGGNQPDGVVFNAFDRLLYVTFRKNGNVSTIANGYALTNDDPSAPETVRNGVANTFNGRPAQGVDLFGRNLLIGTRDGLNVVPNVDTCGPPASTCNVKAITPLTVDIPGDGTRSLGSIVGVMTYGQYVYLLSNDLGRVIRWNPVTGGTQLASTTVFSFINGQPNAVFATPGGKIIVGDDTSDGLVLQAGRFWEIDPSTLPPI